MISPPRVSGQNKKYFPRAKSIFCRAGPGRAGPGRARPGEKYDLFIFPPSLPTSPSYLLNFLDAIPEYSRILASLHPESAKKVKSKFLDDKFLDDKFSDHGLGLGLGLGLLLGPRTSDLGPRTHLPTSGSGLSSSSILLELGLELGLGLGAELELNSVKFLKLCRIASNTVFYKGNLIFWVLGMLEA